MSSVPRRTGLGRPQRILSTAVAVAALSWVGGARAQEDGRPPPRPARFEWTARGDELLVSVSFRDVVNAAIRRKLRRGLPTTIVLTGTLYRPGRESPVSTTAQTCKITWHVWHEAYRLELTRPSGSRTRWTTTLEGVLRRCAETRDLLAATRSQIRPGLRVMLYGKVQINPVSPELLAKIKQWVSRPLRTGTAAPGDALFSTFTGLFMRRIGEAERTLEFTTPPTVPKVRASTTKETGSEG